MRGRYVCIGLHQHSVFTVRRRDNNNTGRNEHVPVNHVVSCRDIHVSGDLCNVPRWAIQQHEKCRGMHLMPAGYLCRDSWIKHIVGMSPLPCRNIWRNGRVTVIGRMHTMPSWKLQSNTRCNFGVVV